MTMSISSITRSCSWVARSWLAIVFVMATVLTSAAQSTAPEPASATAPPSTAAPAPANNSAPQNTPSADGVAQEPTAQEPTANDQAGMFVFRKEVEEVILHAAVVDEERRPVPNLDRNAFSVFENGVPQTITSFRRQDVPVAMGIVIDNSGSMRDKRDEVSRAVLNLIRASNPQDEIFVVNFSQKSYLDQDFTSNVNLLQTALHQSTTAGSTALYDAVVASDIHLENNPRLDKKVLLVITDGQDNMSEETLDEAMRRLQQSKGPTIYTIGLMGSGPQEARGRMALQTLAQGTGGVAYFPASLDQVEDITRTIAHDIRSQYLIAYRPRNQNLKPDEKSLRVEAHAPGSGRLTVTVRTGYHNPAGPSH
jgi:Ca-activated chloride channel homolog